ncbi:MAG: pyruvate kinase, partial [Nitrococcus sp.]|nr:pyruvate kinase [Nitrococcus sp.]
MKGTSADYHGNSDQHTRIVATVGPPCRDRDTLRRLIGAGADVFRLNMSHGSHAEHAAVITTLRALEDEVERPLAILLDLCGPKLRLGRFEGGEVAVSAGQRLTLVYADGPVGGGQVPVPARAVFAALRPDTRLLVDDGRLTLHVESVEAERATVWAETDGRLADHKGLNLPDVTLPVPALTEKDQRALAFGLEQGVDWVALSFVQKPEDLETLRERVGKRAGIIAKLEKPAALDALEAVVEACDAVMVARGDLGVEIPPEDVPVAQRRIVRLCRERGRPVIVATQMLDSMMAAPRPTRAEASDVANAVYEGVDAVMLSGETAAGKYPVEAVQMMARIIARVEADPRFWHALDADRPQPSATDSDAICFAVRGIVQVLRLACCVAWTDSGFTALRIARERPVCPILCLTPNPTTARPMVLV